MNLFDTEPASSNEIPAAVLPERRAEERRAGERRNLHSWHAYIWRNSPLTEFDRRQSPRRRKERRVSPIPALERIEE